MIMCCRHVNEPIVTVFLKSDKLYRDRKLEIALCSVCGTLLAELTQFNINTCSYEVFRPKSKHTADFIKKMQKNEWKKINIKTATKANMGFFYGVNKECKNGKIRQYSVDFNGEKKLIKTLEPIINSISEKIY